MKLFCLFGLSFVVGLACLCASAASARGKFDAVDACLKTGAAWNYRESACEPADSGPVDLIRV